MNRPKQTGTKAETCVARYLIAAGVPNVARRTLTGSHDTGDIWIDHGWGVLEVKSRNRAHTWADVDRWMTELDREAVHAETAGAAVQVAALIVKRVGSGPANVGDWHTYMRPDDTAYLLTGAPTAMAGNWLQTPLHTFTGLLLTRMRAPGPYALHA